MNLIITALLFNFLISCWPKTNIVKWSCISATCVVFIFHKDRNKPCLNYIL